jgi:hypothetical protein
VNTPTHLLLSAAIFCKPGDSKRNSAALIGAIVPDIALYGLFAWAKLTAVPDAELWGQIYFSPGYQAIDSIQNSAPLYAAIAVMGWLAKQPLATVFGLSALLHLAVDFPLHHSDAHAHFWPLTDWRFVSPVSYWNPDHYGLMIAPLELVWALVLAVILWRRFKSWPVRVALGLAGATYVLVPLYFILVMRSMPDQLP